jgi:hypothetical protein
VTPPRDSSVGPLIIDAANVIGSVPDGWWHDRRGAAERLRDRIARAARAGALPPADEVILVVEGAARGIPDAPGVRVVSAPGTGDDTIVELVRELGGKETVVTADRLLRERVTRLGAQVVGPRTFRDWLNVPGHSSDTGR